ncbi:MAG: WYL domain-containing protein [Candidatus Gastranaerophilales bacterium]|nr:WYL domain-containing protein [Candidatus Gastranaerophilales bacterium]
MENYIKQHDTHKQVSLTGARALIVMLMLVNGPKTFEQIRAFLVEFGVADREYSVDTIRIDINTLKAIGCHITKATKTNNYCYSLTSHPFRLVVEHNEIQALKRIYKRLARTASPKRLLEYHYLFQRLSNMAENVEIKEELLGISLLKSVDIDLLEKLVSDEKHHNKIKIAYTPPAQKEQEYDITIDKLGIRSGKLYVYCYNHSIGKRSFLNVSRIRCILCNMFDKNTTLGLDTAIKFQLYNAGKYELEENETIIEEDNDYITISGRYFNDFIGIQRILSFGSDCTVIEPEEIKSQIIEKLKEMRSVYAR